MGPTMRELCPAEPFNPVNRLGWEEPAWFALSVKHQHERQVAAALSSNGVEPFVPLYRTRHRWSDRVKELDAPLFPGYVFGRFAARERVQVLRIPGVSRIVGFGGLPVPVPAGEMEGVRAALASKLPFGPWPYPKAGERVRIEGGPLQGVEGTLLRQSGALRLVVSVELLQRSLAVEVGPELISPVRNAWFIPYREA